MQFSYLTPEELDLKTVCFRCDFNDPKTNGDIQNLIQQPLVAYDNSDTLILLSGYRFMAQYQHSTDTSFPVLIYSSEDIPDSLIKQFKCDVKHLPWLIRLAVLDQTRYTDLEIAALLGRAAKTLNCNPNRLINAFPKLRKLENRRQMIQITRLPDSIIRRFQGLKIDLHKSSILSDLSPQDRPSAVVLFCIVSRLSLSRLRQCLQLADILGLRSGQSMRHIFKIARNNFLTDDAMCTSDDLCHWFAARRSPDLHQKQTKYNALVKALNLPENMQVTTENAFESNAVYLKLKVDSVQLLHHLVSHIDSSNPAWKKLFDLLQEEPDRESEREI